jgi:nicotinate-nucleotide adenylyltransferase
MRNLCFGGSFNPIHHGHLICARAVAEQGGFDRVVLIPSGQPPHKSELTDMAAGSHRLAMCRAAVAGDPLFDVETIELDRNKPSYTLETARLLRERGWAEVVWLIGGDMAISLPSWHEAVTLLSEVKFLIMARPDAVLDWGALPLPFRELASNVVEAPQIDISSSEIRRRVLTGRSIDYLTPPAVVKYIHTAGLYKPGK